MFVVEQTHFFKELLASESPYGLTDAKAQKMGV